MNTGYIISGSSIVILTTPPTPTTNAEISVVGLTPTGWRLKPNNTSKIIMGIQSSSVGAAGALSSSFVGSSVRLVSAETGSSATWVVFAAQGNINIV